MSLYRCSNMIIKKIIKFIVNLSMCFFFLKNMNFIFSAFKESLLILNQLFKLLPMSDWNGVNSSFLCRIIRVHYIWTFDRLNQRCKLQTSPILVSSPDVYVYLSVESACFFTIYFRFDSCCAWFTYLVEVDYMSSLDSFDAFECWDLVYLLITLR